jgi:hypothetical protein
LDTPAVPDISPTRDAESVPASKLCQYALELTGREVCDLREVKRVRSRGEIRELVFEGTREPLVSFGRSFRERTGGEGTEGDADRTREGERFSEHAAGVLRGVGEAVGESVERGGCHGRESFRSLEAFGHARPPLQLEERRPLEAEESLMLRSHEAGVSGAMNAALAERAASGDEQRECTAACRDPRVHAREEGLVDDEALVGRAPEDDLVMAERDRLDRLSDDARGVPPLRSQSQRLGRRAHVKCPAYDIGAR